VKMKVTGKKPRQRRAGAKRPRVKVFADGSAVMLDENGVSIGLIEARPKYTTRPSRKRKRKR